MEHQEEVINPALMLAVSRMKENNNLITQNKMIEEALHARFLVPCMMQVKPGTEQESNRNSENTQMNFSMVKNPEGVSYFMAFTDTGEAEKWKEFNKQKVLFMIMSFDDLGDLIRRAGNQSNGFVLNPGTTNVTFQKHIIAEVIVNRNKAIAEGKIKDDSSRTAANEVRAEVEENNKDEA